MLSSAGLRAQDGDASATLISESDRLIVGGEARVVLSAQHDPARSRIAWPIIPDSFGKLEVLNKDKIDTIKQGGFVQYRQLLLVTGFDSGLFRIPPFGLKVSPAAGAPYVIQTGAIDLLVQPVPVDTTKPFKPIKGIMIVEASWRDYIWWIVAGIFALLAIVLIVYFMRQKKHRIPPPPPAPEPLHVRAIRLLDALEAEQLWQRGEVKEYYVRLTDILRGYIEARFGVKAMERTTDELAAAARLHPGLSPYANGLFAVLATADMAKFARAQPLPAEHVAAMQATKDFITTTIPVPEPVPQTEAPRLPQSNQPDRS
jgi:hypothetical protein